MLRGRRIGSQILKFLIPSASRLLPRGCVGGACSAAAASLCRRTFPLSPSPRRPLRLSHARKWVRAEPSASHALSPVCRGGRWLERLLGSPLLLCRGGLWVCLCRGGAELRRAVGVGECCCSSVIQKFILGEFDDDATAAYHENSTSELADDDHHVKDRSKRYHVHFYTNRTVCDLTEIPRETEVGFVCSEPTVLISSIKEISSSFL
ncbi:uncharacterized protein [Miscanthus floridulus]|uniref:uncharacterized protein n=1 Tax=Miscanthus floridulus TaxID=154761 RepID=UPI003458449A